MIHAPIPIAPVLKLPHSIPVVRQLEQRGVRLQADDDETREACETRLETALMALFRDTSGEAEFQVLYEYTRAGLLQWITSAARGHLRAADPLELLQDTFVNIYRYAASFRDEAPHSFRVWSRTIAGNLLRRSKRTRSGTWAHSLPDGHLEPADRRAGPPEAMVSAEQCALYARAWMIVLQQYARAFEQLSRREQIALDLIEVQGRSYAEASAQLKVGASNMKMILFRARRRIRARIADALVVRTVAERRIAV